MTALITEPIGFNERLDVLQHDITASTLGETLGATAEEAFATSPLANIRNLDETAVDTRPPGTERRRGTLPRMLVEPDQGPALPPTTMTPDEANARFGIKGALDFKEPVTEDVARLKREAAQQRLQRQDVLRRASQDVGTWSARLLTGLAVSALDPLNVAAAFIPVVGEARFATWAGDFGLTAARMAKGGIEGAVGTAALEPIIYAGQRAIGNQDYSAVDSLVNIAFGTVLGGGLHTAVGAVGDFVAARAVSREVQALSEQVDSLSLEAREAALRTSVAQVASGEPVDVSPILRMLDERGGAGARVIDNIDFLRGPEAEADFAMRTGAAEPVAIAEARDDRVVTQRPASAEQIAAVESRIAALEQERLATISDALIERERRAQINTELRRTDLDPAERQRLERERAAIPERRPQREVLRDLIAARAERDAFTERPPLRDWEREIAKAARATERRRVAAEAIERASEPASTRLAAAMPDEAQISAAVDGEVTQRPRRATAGQRQPRAAETVEPARADAVQALETAELEGDVSAILADMDIEALPPAVRSEIEAVDRQAATLEAGYRAAALCLR